MNTRWDVVVDEGVDRGGANSSGLTDEFSISIDVDRSSPTENTINL
jgi:hypothetical protein